MSSQSVIPAPPEQSLPYEAADVAQGVGMQLASFLFPLLVMLDSVLDKRLVRTFLGSIQSILAFRDRIHGLLLTELGAALLTPEREGAGTKRLATLIHSKRWSSQIIDAFLWSWATSLLEGMVAVGQDVYAIWDESVWEKPESIKREDLGPVRSSKAHRLTHVKPGYYRPPRRPIFVPGLNWLGVILVGAQPKGGVPCLAAMRWWSNRGSQAERKRKLDGGPWLRCFACGWNGARDYAAAINIALLGVAFLVQEREDESHAMPHKHPTMKTKPLNSVSYKGIGLALRLPPTSPRGRLLFGGKIYVNGWLKSVTLHSALSKDTMLRLCG